MSESPSPTEAPQPTSQEAVPWNKPWPRPTPPIIIITTFDCLSQFPDEIIGIIRDNTVVRDLLNFVRVSRRFYGILQRCLWRAASSRLFGLPMFLGAIRGSIPMMKEFLRYGCDVNKTRQSRRLGLKHGIKPGHRPLHLAVISGHADAVDWLLAHGANTDINHPRRFDHYLSLLLLAAPWKKYMECSEPEFKEALPALSAAWLVPEGPRYRIFAALLTAGARPPPGEEATYLQMAASCCRTVSAPALQQMLLHGADPNHLCPCDDHAKKWGTTWIWSSPRRPCCFHRTKFQPWPRPVWQIINTAKICHELAERDVHGQRIYSPDVDF